MDERLRRGPSRPGSRLSLASEWVGLQVSALRVSGRPLPPHGGQARLRGTLAIDRCCRGVGHHVRMEPTTEDKVDLSTSTEPEDLDTRAARKRRSLWELHGRRTADEDVSTELVRQVVSMTDEVLKLERAAADHRESQAHQRSTRVILLCAAALTLGPAATLASGWILGWLGGWGIALLVTNTVLGLGLPAAHAAAARAGHRRRRHHMVAALVLGVAAAIPAVGWLPWWIGLIAIVAAGANGLAYLTTLADQSAGRSGRSRPTTSDAGAGHG